MTGIYSITNKKTNQSYIGQSVNIERRFEEHRLKASKQNTKLSKDIYRFGIDNFELNIIEECSKSELNAKELYHIKKIKPYYNTIGKPVSEKTKKLISIKTKEWWNSLDTSKQNKIINNNLTGPKIGHEVKAETRDKIRKKLESRDSTMCMILETGMVFTKVMFLEKYLGASTGTVAAYMKGKIKTVKGFHVVKCRD